MALAWLRRSSRAVAAVVLLVSMWQMPHLGQDDDICAPAQAEAHDESKHVFTTPTAAADQEHCAICHWVRSMNLGLGMRELTAVPVESDSRFLALVSHSLRDPGTNRIPARAPPIL
jgi:hypothetical protein